MAQFMNLAVRRNKIYKVRQNLLEDLNDVEFYLRFRMTKATHIIELVRPSIQFATRQSMATTPEIQVLATILYMRSPIFQLQVGDLLGLSQKTISNCVYRVTAALANLSSEFIIFPATNESVAENVNGFFRMSGFPSVVGIVDGTHIRVQAPSLATERDYVNRKNLHSVNVQVVIDYRGRFTNVVANWPGSAHDSFIMRNSNIWQGYENGQLRGIILGDSGYALKPWLMTPFRNPNTTSQQRFNTSLCRTRRLVENAIGWWKRKFHSLHSELRIDIQAVPQYIIATAVLHNISRAREFIDFGENENNEEPNLLPTNFNNGNQMRNYVVENYYADQ